MNTSLPTTTVNLDLYISNSRLSEISAEFGFLPIVSYTYSNTHNVEAYVNPDDETIMIFNVPKVK